MHGHRHPPPTQPTSGQQVIGLIALGQYASALLPAFFSIPGTCGSQCFAGPALISLVVMTVFVTLVDGERAAHPYGLYAAGVAVALLFVHRVAHVVRVWRGSVIHSRYTGIPWLGWGHEASAKSILQPCLTFLAAAGCSAFSPGLSAWLFIAGLGHAIAVSYSLQARNAQLRAMQDARIEQQLLQEEMRRQGPS